MLTEAGGGLVNLPGTSFNIRWYHLYLTLAFVVVANLYNFQLNRTWTFRSASHARWYTEYWPFLCVGLAAFTVGLALATLMIHPHTPLSLPPALDDSSGVRDRSYWANLTQIGHRATRFILNKLWTFSSVRGGPRPVSFEEAERLSRLSWNLRWRSPARDLP